ncbi:glycosyltransferase [Hyperthermus butylicus]|uniref:Conserved crenarchaeal protein n=1 Tax=Hyperthermus butylicus (strain DSM 5456 / JCM 9403 / PLM1-5) TaxID=415426 RepID=A2BMN2_HYPBU|nr:glycosyltransferase [Hyperthermus butylicus]ABM81243.1 conserved crenarchaeal protein [Hyperthermus butylicus DSM 5456]
MAVVAVTAARGGHSGRALALAEELVRHGVEVVAVIAEGDEWTRARFQGHRVVEVPLLRTPTDSRLAAALRAPRALMVSLRRLPKGLCALVSLGSNLSIAPAVTAKLRGARLYVVEDIVRFVAPSATARLLAPIADRVVLQWEEQRKLHSQGVVYGPFYPRPRYPPRDGGYVLIATGTLGYPGLVEAAARLPYDHVVVQTGRLVDPEKLPRRPGLTVFRFDPDFHRWLAGARVVVTHLGHTAVEAALTYGKPVVIVYNPMLGRTAGLKPGDAEAFAMKLNAILIEGEPTVEELARAIEEAGKRRPPQYPNGAEKLAEELAGLCQG